MSSVDYLSAINTKSTGLNVTQIVDSLVVEIAQRKRQIRRLKNKPLQYQH